MSTASCDCLEEGGMLPEVLLNCCVKAVKNTTFLNPPKTVYHTSTRSQSTEKGAQTENLSNPDGTISTASCVTTWDSLRKTDLNSLHPSDRGNGIRVEIFGYITSKRPGGNVDFIQLVDPRLEMAVQIIKPKATPKDDSGGQSLELGRTPRSAKSDFDLLFEESGQQRPHTPVQVGGRIVRRFTPPKAAKQPIPTSGNGAEHRESGPENTIPSLDPFIGHVDLIDHVEIQVDYIRILNEVLTAVVPKCDTVLPPESRHWHFRTDPVLRRRIRLRSQLALKIRQHMLDAGFDEIETPLLFKSTPEGAREFLVPTRKLGKFYALPQSPQQYKQVLMASGISRYFQFAKCFRDEDLRADRQPEFTQLDLEMAFSGSVEVMSAVEDLLTETVWPAISDVSPLPKLSNSTERTVPDPLNLTYDALHFPQLTYKTAMSRYGSDKPDTRFGSEIHRVETWIPPSLKGMMTSLDDSIVEMIKVDMHGSHPTKSDEFIKTFLSAPSTARYVNDPDRTLGVAVYNPRMPLQGLAAFGHEGAVKVEQEFQPEPGDIFLVYTREDTPFFGGSTPLGDLRRDVYQSAITQGLIPAPSGFSALWVTDFPLFSPVAESEPGQGGFAGICSTHHPFTTLKKGQSLSMLVDKPLDIIGDHYDLVINGVEVGGGSRRIHQPRLQTYILKHVLKMEPERVQDFDHLLRALGSGCPPHAGFALGFDRLLALLTNTASVRDVIAFPKYADGEDKFVGTPSSVTQAQLATYHLKLDLVS